MPVDFESSKRNKKRKLMVLIIQIALGIVLAFALIKVFKVLLNNFSEIPWKDIIILILIISALVLIGRY